MYESQNQKKPGATRPGSLNRQTKGSCGGTDMTMSVDHAGTGRCHPHAMGPRRANACAGRKNAAAIRKNAAETKILEDLRIYSPMFAKHPRRPPRWRSRYSSRCQCD